MFFTWPVRAIHRSSLLVLCAASPLPIKGQWYATLVCLRIWYEQDVDQTVESTFWYPIFKSSHCNSFENPEHIAHLHLQIKRVEVTRQHGRCKGHKHLSYLHCRHFRRKVPDYREILDTGPDFPRSTHQGSGQCYHLRRRTSAHRYHSRSSHPSPKLSLYHHQIWTWKIHHP